MKISTKSILAIAAIVISTTLSYPLSAQARSRKSSPRPGRSRRGQPARGRGSDHGLTLNLDLGKTFTSGGSRRWVPGYYQTHTERVLVEPGHYRWRNEKVLIEPGHYEIRRTVQRLAVRRQKDRHASADQARKVRVKPARTAKIKKTKVWIPARYEIRRVKTYVPPRYETRQVRVHVPGHWVSRPAPRPARSWLNLDAIFRFKF